MLITTVYNQANAVITGCYYDPKGNRIDVEYMGTALECECYINAVRQDNEGCNEVQSVVNYAVETKCNDVSTDFVLHNIWSAVASMPTDFETEYRSIHQ